MVLSHCDLIEKLLQCTSPGLGIVEAVLKTCNPHGRQPDGATPTSPVNHWGLWSFTLVHPRLDQMLVGLKGRARMYLLNLVIFAQSHWPLACSDGSDIFIHLLDPLHCYDSACSGYNRAQVQGLVGRV